MIVFVQRVIVIILNVFLVFLLVSINKQKKRNEMKDMEVSVINKQGGTPLEFEIRDIRTKHVKTGIIETYPCCIGRKESCDIVVDNKEVSNEHFEILPVGDSFRLIRILNGNNQKLPYAKVDGSEKIKRAATFDFKKSIEVALAEQVVMHLKMKESQTKKYFY